MLIDFDNDLKKLVDGALFKSIGIEKDADKVLDLTPEKRLTMLEYLFLCLLNDTPAYQNKASSLFAEEILVGARQEFSALPKIQTYDDLDTKTENRIRKVREKISQSATGFPDEVKKLMDVIITLAGRTQNNRIQKSVTWVKIRKMKRQKYLKFTAIYTLKMTVSNRIFKAHQEYFPI